ncbi:Zinc phosphodiesterase ELAC protein 2 [Leucoagaricus sp. SymC.cos]|nr:Zinc phosphodiesterase ELAC protein 2 [Leucoagaricus sp. SymC.cos]
MQPWSTTVITPLSYDTEPTVLVQFDSAKYIFNVGENTNRSFLQSRKNWRRTKGIFLTQVNSQRAIMITRRLSGMVMALADGGIERLSIVGPPGLLHYLATKRMFMYRNQLTVSPIECLPDQDAAHPEVFFKDENITVYSFPISQPGSFPNFESSFADSDEPGQKRKRADAANEPRKVPRLNERNVPEPDGLRAATLKYMFRSETPTVEGDALPPDEYKRRNPRWFYRQLPSFSFPPTYPQSSTLAYIVVGPRFRGHIDGKKLKELQVPNNPLRGKLTKGETIQFEVKGPDGPEMRTVRPEEVMGKSDPPAVVVILDVPFVEMVPSVVRSFDTVYKPFRSSDPSDLEKHTVRVVYHLLGPGVLEDERYIGFIKGFPGTAEHIFSSPEHNPNPVIFTSHGLVQYRLSQLDSDAFPLPKFSTSPPKSLKDIPSLPSNTHVLAPNYFIPLRPTGPLQQDQFLPSDKFHPAFTQPQPLPELTAAAFKEAKEAVSRHPVVQGQQPTGVKILPLGTSSAVPTIYRNVSSILVKTPDGNILLDAGEGTTGQLMRRFGLGSDEDFNNVLANLKCIFVSHVHGDHQTGLAKLLRQRKLLPHPPNHPLYLVSIRSVHLALREHHELENIGLCENPSENGVIQIMSDALNFEWDEYPQMGRWHVGGNEPWLDLQRSRKHNQDLRRSLNLDWFGTIDVDHRTKAFGVQITHANGWSITYSGDTMPTPNLVRSSQGVTLLIHEATMGDDQEHLALEKAHSTIGQAMQTARDMNADNVLLTHFSARYPKMPPSILAPPDENTTERKDPLVTVALDLAEMDLDNMWKMNLYLPAIEQCFKDSLEEGDEDLYAAIP